MTPNFTFLKALLSSFLVRISLFFEILLHFPSAIMLFYLSVYDLLNILLSCLLHTRVSNFPVLKEIRESGKCFILSREPVKKPGLSYVQLVHSYTAIQKNKRTNNKCINFALVFSYNDCVKNSVHSQICHHVVTLVLWQTILQQKMLFLLQLTSVRCLITGLLMIADKTGNY